MYRVSSLYILLCSIRNKFREHLFCVRIVTQFHFCSFFFLSILFPFCLVYCSLFRTLYAFMLSSLTHSAFRFRRKLLYIFFTLSNDTTERRLKWHRVHLLGILVYVCSNNCFAKGISCVRNKLAIVAFLILGTLSFSSASKNSCMCMFVVFTAIEIRTALEKCFGFQVVNKYQ